MPNPAPRPAPRPISIAPALLVAGLVAVSWPGIAQDREAPSRRVLRVSADPNNLPFTNDRLEGFENKIAVLLAREMDADLSYVWRAQRRGFFRSALTEGECDLVMGVPAGFERALTTAPYYRSGYAF